MNSMSLTSADLGLLFEAVEAYECKASSDALNSMLIGAILTPKEQQEEFKASTERTMKEMKESGRAAKERCAVLKAKLVLLRESITASEMTEVR